MLWPRAATKSGKWYRGVVEAADCFMARWHRGEAQMRHAAKDTNGGDHQLSTKFECRNEKIMGWLGNTVRLALEF